MTLRIAARNATRKQGLLDRTHRERLFLASSCVLVLDKGVTIACARRFAVGRYGSVKVSPSAQRVTKKRLARADSN